MGSYKGISKKKMLDGSISVMVRFKHLGRAYPVKNFTKLFGCKTEKSAFEKLIEVKKMLSENKDPFVKSKGTLNELFYERLELNEKNLVWAKSTVKNNKVFYDKHIKPIIGVKRIEKVKYEDIMKIINSFTKIQTSSKNRVIHLLRPIFEEEKNKGILIHNEMDKIKSFTNIIQKEDLDKRSNFEYTTIVRELYKAIPRYKQAHKSNIEQHRMFLYMLLMTAHRFGEVEKLEKEHFNFEEMKIIAPKKITKTKENYHYPIPDEVVEYVKTHKGGRLFNVPKGGTAGRVFHRLLIEAKITTIDNHSISMHDTRKLMVSIMVNELGIDSRLADYCLEHKMQGTIKHYLEFSYKDKVRAYKKYWNYIREVADDIEAEEENNIITEKDKTNTNKSNFDKLKELISMLENGYLTKEQFEYERDNLY